MKLRIHRGAHQIGGSCVEIEHEGQRIILDYGLPLDGNSDNEDLAPMISDADGISAVLISHPHIDHYGLLHYLNKNIPVAIGEAAKNIIQSATPFMGQPMPHLDGYTLRDRESLLIGQFKITPYLMDHSAYDSYAIMVEAGGKRVFYSGDLRAHGRKRSLFERLIHQPPKDVDVLFLEGSSLSRLEDDAQFPSEEDLEMQFVEQFKNTDKLIAVHASAQNIDRIVSIYRACKRTGRTLVIDLYAAAIFEATGNINIPQSGWPNIKLFTPSLQRSQIYKNKWFDLLDRHKTSRIYPEGLQKAPEKYVVLFRPLYMKDFDNIEMSSKIHFVYSQWDGYLSNGTYSKMKDWLAKNEVEITHVHTSGHASPVDLRRFADALQPKAIVPIHSFAPEKYSDIFNNVTPRNDGEWWEV